MHRIRVHLLALALAGAALAIVFVASAEASRAPTSFQQSAITSAVHASSVGGMNRIPQREYRVTGVRVSSVSRSWARADLTAAPAFRSTFQNASVIAVNLAGTRRWVVVDLGSAQVGCGIAPDKVLADLFQTKDPCPTGSGGIS